MADKMQTRQYTEFQFVAGTTGKTLTVHDADVAQWLEDIIDERDELVQMGALDGRKLTEEVDALRHDIARHVQIAAEQAQELEELRTRLADAEALAIRRGDIQVRLQADLAAARAELADMRIELDAARDNVEEWVKRYKAQSSKFNWDKSSDANPNNWR